MATGAITIKAPQQPGCGALTHRPHRHRERLLRRHLQRRATAGIYQIRSGDPARSGRMPGWLAREITRVTKAGPPRPATPPPLFRPGGPGPAAYLTTVINRGTARLAALTDGRKRALSALAYHAGGLLEWSGLNRDHVTSQLIDAGTTAGLGPGISARIVNRAITNGISRPVAQPGSRS